MSYATRSGRVSRGQIERTSPRFFALYNRLSADKASSAIG